MKIIAGTLTEQELQAAYLATHDLGPGYPQLDVPPYARQLYLDKTAEDLSLKFAPQWTAAKQLQVDLDLDCSVRRFLSMPENDGLCLRPTFSGSVALDRAIAATQIIARKRGKKRLVVITTTPCIDIMSLFLAERADVRAVFVESNKDGHTGCLDMKCLMEHVANAQKKADKEHCTVMLSSPENPTGAVWKHDELLNIAKACEAANATLIVDHCFAFAGVHQPQDVPRIWNVAEGVAGWIAVWDTGKTFGLNEDKLGFVIGSGKETNSAIDAAVAVIQFGVSRRSKIFFTELLRLAMYYDHVRQLNELCVQNLSTLKHYLSPRLPLFPTQAGSLALIDIGSTGRSDEEIRQLLLANGVGTVAGNIFFHSEWRPSHLLRLALARRTDYFEEAVSRIIQVLS